MEPRTLAPAWGTLAALGAGSLSRSLSLARTLSPTHGSEQRRVGRLTARARVRVLERRPHDEAAAPPPAAPSFSFGDSSSTPSGSAAWRYLWPILAHSAASALSCGVSSTASAA